MSDVEVDKVLGLCDAHVSDYSLRIPVDSSRTMRHEAAEVPADNAVPSSAFPHVKLRRISIWILET